MVAGYSPAGGGRLAGLAPPGRPRHQSLEVFGNLGYLSLPDASCSFLSVCCGHGWSMGAAGLAVDLRIPNRSVNGDGALERIVEEREVHSP